MTWDPIWYWGWCNQPCSWHGLRARSPGLPYGTPHSSPGRSRVGQYQQQRHCPSQCLFYAPCRRLPTTTLTPPSWATRHHFSFPLGVLHVVAFGSMNPGWLSEAWPLPYGRGPCNAQPPSAGRARYNLRLWAEALPGPATQGLVSGHGLRPVGGDHAMPSHPSVVPPLSQLITSYMKSGVCVMN